MMKNIKDRLLKIDLPDEQRRLVEEAVQEEVDTVAELLREMIFRWEEMSFEDDNSLYTLGIRRSIDVVTGADPFGQLPILETEDTPDE